MTAPEKPPSDSLAPDNLVCRVAELHAVTHDIMLLRLGFAPEERLRFRAGQYVRASFPGQPARDFSIASRPGSPMLEFHIRNLGSGVSAFVWQELKLGDPVEIEGPFGDSFLREDHDGPILAIAGGSGLAPIKSIVEAALTARPDQEIHLYFGARDERDIYLEGHFGALAERHKGLSFIPVLSEPTTETGRRTGYVGDVAADDFVSFAGFQAYLAGPPVMVESAVARLRARGLAESAIHADAYYSEAEMRRRRGKS